MNLNNKIIGVSAYNQIVMRNFFHSGLADRLKADGFHLKIFTYSFKKNNYEDLLRDKKIKIVSLSELEKNNIYERIVRRIFIILQKSHYSSFRHSELAGATKYLTSLFSFLSISLNSRPLLKINFFLINLFRNILVLTRQKNKKLISELQECHIFFSTDLFGEEDFKILSQAESINIKTLSMVRSWDNCYSKGILRLAPHKIIVNNKDIKTELIKLHFCTAESIKIVGFPQYDRFKKSEYLKKLAIKFANLNANNFILFCPAGDLLSKSDDDILQDLVDVLRELKLTDKYKIIVRNHPAHPAKIKERNKVQILKTGILYKEGQKFSDFSSEDTDLYNALLYFSDLVIHISSSVAVDSLAFKKHQIIINYDGHKELGYLNSVKRYHDEEHMQFFINTKAPYLVNNFEELKNSVHKSLICNLKNKYIDREYIRRFDVNFGKSIDTISSVITNMANN